MKARPNALAHLLNELSKMKDIIEFVQTHNVTWLELSCGHTIFMTMEFEKQRRKDHKTWFCTVCGSPNHWPQESDEDKLRRECNAAKQREETLRQQRKNLEDALAKEQASIARLKKRIHNGVCPFCKRKFSNVQKHMAHLHQDFKGK